MGPILWIMRSTFGTESNKRSPRLLRLIKNSCMESSLGPQCDVTTETQCGAASGVGDGFGTGAICAQRASVASRWTWRSSSGGIEESQHAAA
ncbi:hypothetical protein Q8A67_025787 [Cirrhinus molitorella]|uniref:Uncharacterized protein n=1 Tax=Cirrhinus molitorella TaxID=172907 RepID=A0AA88NY81_9TELE|nr:hypothetical protein Q8A67_025787 [Cirrhinus molitorella]